MCGNSDDYIPGSGGEEEGGGKAPNEQDTTRGNAAKHDRSGRMYHSNDHRNGTMAVERRASVRAIVQHCIWRVGLTQATFIFQPMVTMVLTVSTKIREGPSEPIKKAKSFFGLGHLSASGPNICRRKCNQQGLKTTL